MRKVRHGSTLGMLMLSYLALSACGGESSPAAASATPSTTSPASASPSASTSSTGSASPSATATTIEAVGEQMGAKIAFYAVAKAAGMDDSAKMDELASGICS